MKLKRIELKGYRNHTDTSVELGHVTVFCGPNGGGKSSILSAVPTVLIGENEWTDQVSVASLIQSGMKKAEVTLVGNNPVTKLIRDSGSQVRIGTTAITQERLLTSLGVTPQLVRAMCRTQTFLSLAPGDQQDILFGLMGFTMSEDSIVTEVEGWCVRNGGKVILREMMNEENVSFPHAAGLAAFDALFDAATVARRHANREVDRLTKLAEVATADLALVSGSLFTREMSSEQEDLEKRRDQLMKDLGAVDSAKKLADNLQRDADRLNKEIEECKKRLAGHRPDRDQKLRDRIAELTVQHSRFASEAKGLQPMIASLRNEREMLNRGVESVAPDRPEFRCPVFTMDCPASLKERQSAIKSRADGIAELNKKIIEVVAKESRLNQAADSAKKDSDFAEVELRASLATKASDLKAKQAEAEKELDRVLNERNSLSSVGDESQIREKLKTTEDKLALLRQKKDAAGRAEDMKRRADCIADDLEEHRRRSKEWDLVVKATDSSGAKADLLKTKLGALEERVNQRLAWLTGGKWKVWLLSEGRYQLKVQSANSIMRDVGTLSQSEMRMLQLAIQDALSQLSKLRLLIIDEVELLDDETFKHFSEFVAKVKDDYDTVLIGMTLQHGIVRSIPGARQYLVEGGQVKLLESEPAHA